MHDYGLVPFFTTQLNLDTGELERLARVTAVHRSRCDVAGPAGDASAELDSTLQRAPAIDRPTVGDWVVLDETGERIERVLERKSLFKRVAAGTDVEYQPIAANIDTLFIVSSCNAEFKESRLERYLALSEEANVMPVVILTKADLSDAADEYTQRARTVKANLPVETVNALDSDSLQGLRAWIDRNATIALVGSSGVGKSTLINTLAGRDLTATGGIREQDKKGRHTTTHRALYPLPDGGFLIDVPGMRELRVADVEDALDNVFDEITRLARQCRFSDCRHESEPGCAVRRAIDEGRLDARRLENYHRLQRESAQASASLAEKRAKGKDLARMVREVKHLKQSRHDS